MKIIPDRIYCSMQCGASRISSGSGMILPLLSLKIPLGFIDPKWRGFVMPGVILGVIVAGFTEPRLMLLIVPAWVVTAWKLGVCPHCRDSATRNSATSDAEEQQ